MIGSCHIEYLVIESILSTNFPIIDEPLVAGIVDRRIGHSIAMESSLKKSFGQKSRLETSDRETSRTYQMKLSTFLKENRGGEKSLTDSYERRFISNKRTSSLFMCRKQTIMESCREVSTDAFTLLRYLLTHER